MGEEYGETNPFPFFCDFQRPELIEAVREGRKAEFAYFGWEEELPDPFAPSTRDSAVLSWSWDDPGRPACAASTATCSGSVEVPRLPTFPMPGPACHGLRSVSSSRSSEGGRPAGSRPELDLFQPGTRTRSRLGTDGSDAPSVSLGGQRYGGPGHEADAGMDGFIRTSSSSWEPAHHHKSPGPDGVGLPALACGIVFAVLCGFDPERSRVGLL